MPKGRRFGRGRGGGPSAGATEATGPSNNTQNRNRHKEVSIDFDDEPAGWNVDGRRNGHFSGRKQGQFQRWIDKEKDRTTAAKAYYNERFDKERFLHANYSFLVRSCPEGYPIHMADPDQLVDWKLIEQIRVYGHSVPSCPICLYPPSVPKMTQCGHVFCWPCLLHYFCLEGNSWKSCPVCGELTQCSNVKSVQFIHQHEYTAGQKITMKLMRRERGSAYALPVDTWILPPADGNPFRVQDSHLIGNFLKLMTVDYDDINSMIQSERAALQSTLNTAQQDQHLASELPFIEGALLAVDRRQRDLNDWKKQLNQSDPAEPTGSPKPAASAIHQQTIHQQKFYYFYQSADGQPIYLDSLNARCLSHEYGSLANSPPFITATIVHLETDSIHDGLRQRVKCFAHLPVSLQIVHAELALKPPILSPYTLRLFSMEIDQRRADRRTKRQAEQRRDRRINEKHRLDQQRSLAETIPSMQAEIDALSLRPAHFLAPADPPLVGPSSPVDKETTMTTTTTTTSSPVLSDQSSTSGAVGPKSFAAMLKEGKPAGPSCWSAGPSAIPSGRQRSDSGCFLATESADEDDHHPSAPSFQDSFSRGLEQLIDQRLADLSAAADVDQGTAGKRKNRKKARGEQLVLFSSDFLI